LAWFSSSNFFGVFCMRVFLISLFFFIFTAIPEDLMEKIKKNEVLNRMKTCKELNLDFLGFSLDSNRFSFFFFFFFPFVASRLFSYSFYSGRNTSFPLWLSVKFQGAVFARKQAQHWRTAKDCGKGVVSFVLFLFFFFLTVRVRI
jgi:hypothetical protein